ncbi:MAG: alpha/beta fold hydrolase [Sagittula sp.]|uniref:alpha/beta fold hydrolase n=1 Tax=Sagittula sp. TaxID=2038081 RepID=UPI00405A05ED
MRAATPTSEGTIVRDGVTVHYAIHGNGPRTLMFLPAWPIVHSRVYKAQIPYFADHFRVISFDPRGNGLSDRPEDPDAYAPSQNVADALAILDATDTAKASLIGLSLGGLYAALIAAHAPERAEALVGCGAVVPFVPPHPHKSVDVVRATPEARRVGTSSMPTTGRPTMPTSARSSSAGCSASRIPPSRSRMR